MFALQLLPDVHRLRAEVVRDQLLVQIDRAVLLQMEVTTGTTTTTTTTGTTSNTTDAASCPELRRSGRALVGGYGRLKTRFTSARSLMTSSLIWTIRVQSRNLTRMRFEA